MANEYVYFQQHDEKEWIRFGYSGKNNGREDKQPEFQPVALIQASWDDEQALHKYFAEASAKRKGERSTYTGPEIFDYVAWLLNRQFAGRDRYHADRIPRLPWTAWSPEARRNEQRDGALTFFEDAGSLRDRIAFARSDLVHLSSETDDWYTPPYIVEAARTAMGSIDLDPASSYEAQRTVKAAQWYTKELDGLRSDLPWDGNVWLNPPYGKGDGSASAFIRRLLAEIQNRNVMQAVTCLNVNSISALWFVPIWKTAACHLIYTGRINFVNPDRSDTAASNSSSKGTILSYFGPSPDAFKASHQGMGVILDECFF